MWNDTNEMLEQLGYGPEARRQRHEDNMRVLESAAVWGAVAYGASKAVESWKQRRAANAQKQEQQNQREASQAQRYNEWRNQQIAKRNRSAINDLRKRLNG